MQLIGSIGQNFSHLFFSIPINDLMDACISGDIQKAKSVLPRIKKIDILTGKGCIALVLSCQSGHKEIVELLLENGAPVNNQTEEFGNTALTVACHNGHKEIVKLLLENNAAINKQSKLGNTALTLACFYGHKEVAQLLLEKGADINKQDRDGNTALTLACHNGHKEIVELLLKKNANIHLKNNEGQTALAIAHLKKNDKIISLLQNPSKNLETTSPLLLSAKSFLHLTLSPAHALYVMAKDLLFIPYKAGIVAFSILKQFGENFKKFGFLSSAGFFAKSIITHIPKSLLHGIWKIARDVGYAGKMALASAYGIVAPRKGAEKIHEIASEWNEKMLVNFVGL